jgi:RimJ/RimL family protein N-acetyltransferase
MLEDNACMGSVSMGRSRGAGQVNFVNAFDLQPTLQGKLVSLRPLSADDWDELFAVASDPLIWEQHPASDRYREDVFREYFRGALESGGAFAVIDAGDGRIIGSTRYLGYDPENSEIEIGFTFLARCYWGGVYNREMKELLLRHAFRSVRHVVFLVGTTNWRSQKAMEKIGALRVGTRLNPVGDESVVFQLDSLEQMSSKE